MQEQRPDNTFCSRPWSELHIEENGHVTPCCVMPSNRFPIADSIKEYHESHILKEIKHALSSGIKHPNCEWCWSNEAKGIRSHRKNNTPSGGLEQVHIRLNNICNFKCRMCNPRFSTMWAQENKKHNYFVNEGDLPTKNIFEDNSYLFQLLKRNIKNGSLKLINISGGEPLITDANLELLNFLIDNKCTDVTLAYSTNLSVLKHKNVDIFDLWAKFKSVTLEISCDGWGDAVEYSRTGFDTKTFKDNLKKVVLSSVNAQINCVVNVYSVWSLPTLQHICDKLKLKIYYSPCYKPLMLDPQRLLREDKNKLQQLYSNHPKLIDLYNKYIDNDLHTLGKELISYNTLLDSYRGTNFFKSFPMYEKYKEL